MYNTQLKLAKVLELLIDIFSLLYQVFIYKKAVLP